MMTCYDDVMRTIIDLPEEQVEALRQYCERMHVSRAEAVRRAIDGLVNSEEERRARRAQAIKASFGIWKDRGVDTDTYLAELRAEWDREWDQ
jgi:metal-responsive CopG/Arc/MetJ family transcriptional regulator